MEAIGYAVSAAARYGRHKSACRHPAEPGGTQIPTDDLDASRGKAIRCPAANTAHDYGAHTEAMHEAGHAASLAVSRRGHGPRRDDLIASQLGDHSSRRQAKLGC